MRTEMSYYPLSTLHVERTVAVLCVLNMEERLRQMCGDGLGSSCRKGMELHRVSLFHKDLIQRKD